MGLGLQKCFLCIINFPTFLVGAGILGVSVYLLVGDPLKTVLAKYVPPSSANILDLITSFKAMSIIIYFGIGLGSLLFLAGFFGCCGALTENKCMLIIYSIIVTVIFIILVGSAIAGAAMKNKIFETTKSFLRDKVFNQYTGNATTSVYTLIFDSLQLLFHCCGVHNATDYANLPSWNPLISMNGTSVNLSYPPTCCKFNVSIFDIKNISAVLIGNCLVTYKFNDLYSNTHTGCFDKLISMIAPYMTILFGAIGGLAVLLLIVDVCSCYMIKKK